MPKTLTPLRYPGGKTQLYPLVSKIIKKNFDTCPIYAEAFSGGFGIGIALLLNNDVRQVIINDLDYCIYCLWKCITSTKLHKSFVNKIIETDINIENWNIQKNIYINYKNYSMLEIGFATLFLNRCNRSGILKAGPIGGKNQNGNYKINCRFDKNNIINKINSIYARRKDIHVYNLDAINFINLIDRQNNNVFFNLDPPYVAAGQSLYKNYYNESNHIELSETIQNISNKWILTYDNNSLIKNLYSSYNIDEFSINYYLKSYSLEKELLIYNSNKINM